MSAHNTQKIPNSQSVSVVFPLYKKAGETLAELIARFRLEQSFNESLPITYAGRLDPMAEGLVILLIGEACKQKDQYLGLDKTYIFEVLFGVATDTFDMLGLVTKDKEMKPMAEQIEKAVEEVKKIKTFSYPPYSSKPVAGVPLFVHAKAGTLPSVLPTMEGKIHSLAIKDIRTISFIEALNEKLEIIKEVKGDFRQNEITEAWKNFLKQKLDKDCCIAMFEVSVSSGVYVRTIAKLIGEVLGGPALAYSIKRTQVGDFSL